MSPLVRWGYRLFIGSIVAAVALAMDRSDDWHLWWGGIIVLSLLVFAVLEFEEN